MHIVTLLKQNPPLCHIEGGSKKRLFQILAETLSQQYPDLTQDAIFEGLTRREKLGSTGIGNGVAIPHCRSAGCAQLIAQVATLAEPIEYDAMDGRAVDIVFLLIAPVEHCQEHLDALAQIAHFFEDAAVRLKLRKAKTRGELLDIALRMAERAPQKSPIHL
jgi:PTS system nitrogen regulatory IIA component